MSMEMGIILIKNTNERSSKAIFIFTRLTADSKTVRFQLLHKILHNLLNEAVAFKDYENLP